jgi:hypothetical protein
VIGLIGAVEAGVGLWYFTNGHWINGILYVIAFAVLISVYIRRERKLKGARQRVAFLAACSDRFNALTSATVIWLLLMLQVPRGR